MKSKCYYYLSSPSANRTDIIYYVSPKGHVSIDSWPNASVNFCPLFCLKSDVHLVEKKNGDKTTYELELD